jgi:hypothetical protein
MKRLTGKLKSIEGAILLFFLLRLTGITNAPLETWHSWRQTLTNMMARNMSEGNFSLLYPMVDTGGSRTGIIGSEFPLFQALIAGFNLIFGFDHWYGRLINLIVSSLAVWCFFRLISRWWNERTAWYATLILLSSLWFSFSRKSMPDTFSVALVVTGIWFCQRFIDSHRRVLLLPAFLLLTLGGLCKIPAVFLFVLIVPMWTSGKVRYGTKITLTGMLGLSSVIILWWYFHWVPYLVSTYDFQLYFPKSLSEGWSEIRPLIGDFAKQFWFGALRSYVVLLPLIAGIAWLFYRNHRREALAFLLLAVVFLVFCIKTGAVFPTHNYYILPFVPVMAAIAGVGLQRLDSKLAVPLLILIIAEGVGNQVSDFFIKDEVEYRLSLEAQVNSAVPSGEKIVIPTGADPQWMYFYHRKGWSVEPAEITDPGALHAIGVPEKSFIVIDKRADQPKPAFPLFRETADLLIYRFP